MKGFFEFVGVCVFLLIAVSTCGGESDKFPIIYYYSTDAGSATYTLNKDETCKITKKFNRGFTSDYTYDTSWNRNGGHYWIKSERGSYEIIKEGYLYLSSDDADAKRNGVKLTKREQK